MADDNGRGRIITGGGGVKAAGPVMSPAMVQAILSGKTPRVAIDVVIDDAAMQKVGDQLRQLHEQATAALAMIGKVIAKAKELKDTEVGTDAVQPEGPARLVEKPT